MLRQLQRLSPVEQERYRQNSRRLLDFGGFTRHPDCPTLVLAGEYDHFTQPWEHAQFAAACADADCALIEHGDHLAQFERRDACSRLYVPFFEGRPLPQLAPAPPASRAACSAAWKNARNPGSPRGTGRLFHPQLGELAVEISELGFFGGRLHGDLPTDLPARGWRLRAGELPDLELLPLRRQGDALSLVFTHVDADASAALAAQVGPWQMAAAAA